MIKTRLKYLKFTKPPRSGEKIDLGEKKGKNTGPDHVALISLEPVTLDN